MENGYDQYNKSFHKTQLLETLGKISKRHERSLGIKEIGR